LKDTKHYIYTDNDMYEPRIYLVNAYPTNGKKYRYLIPREKEVSNYYQSLVGTISTLDTIL
jgi:hypothetical protein